MRSTSITGQATNGTQFFNCEFRDNTAGDGDGGAFKSELRGQAGTLFPAGIETTFVNCLFVDNDADGSGGAVHVSEEDVADFWNCTIVNNSAGDYGGGARCLNSTMCDTTSGVLLIRNSIFWENS